ncbi:hypothetical protein GNI_049550 [Gregarina niphandrodes]|uniref:Uncharacterized protein n=1 Tax=Gregarina niphandrodes TaxID=110365 RepID=A0A023B9J3_GRENI|nr:hypothetical protein GNI_049550 [Gregarina niphandrodes]EZG72978.1 hypothetical protein GNI_049550 [Gregarina niphandrodes]|eukprot:XP_011129673.1 hypothetical protein GNI_049550 [Gregarina niphandrodes]
MKLGACQSRRCSSRNPFVLAVYGAVGSGKDHLVWGTDASADNVPVPASHELLAQNTAAWSEPVSGVTTGGIMTGVAAVVLNDANVCDHVLDMESDFDMEAPLGDGCPSVGSSTVIHGWWEDRLSQQELAVREIVRWLRGACYRYEECQEIPWRLREVPAGGTRNLESVNDMPLRTLMEGMLPPALWEGLKCFPSASLQTCNGEYLSRAFTLASYVSCPAGDIVPNTKTELITKFRAELDRDAFDVPQALEREFMEAWITGCLLQWTGVYTEALDHFCETLRHHYPQLKGLKWDFKTQLQFADRLDSSVNRTVAPRPSAEIDLPRFARLFKWRELLEVNPKSLDESSGSLAGTFGNASESSSASTATSTAETYGAPTARGTPTAHGAPSARGAPTTYRAPTTHRAPTIYRAPTAVYDIPPSSLVPGAFAVTGSYGPGGVPATFGNVSEASGASMATGTAETYEPIYETVGSAGRSAVYEIDAFGSADLYGAPVTFGAPTAAIVSDDKKTTRLARKASTVTAARAKQQSTLEFVDAGKAHKRRLAGVPPQTETGQSSPSAHL